MEPRAIWLILLTLALFAVGAIVIRLVGLGLPMPTTLGDVVRQSFWMYRADVDRQRVVRNKVAWLAIVCIIYFVVTAAFF